MPQRPFPNGVSALEHVSHRACDAPKRRWTVATGATARFEGRDLAVTTDFRDVFSEVVVKHLGADPATAARVFPGYTVEAPAFRGILRT